MSFNWLIKEANVTLTQLITGRRNSETFDLDFKGGKTRQQGIRNHPRVEVHDSAPFGP
jgi:hypothetical protein